jgi:hypothetical protein
MPDENAVVREFLASMVPVREALGDFVRALYKRPEVKLVHTYHPLAYSCSDFGVSAELRNEVVVDFWIELDQKDSQWELSYYISRHDPDEDGSHSERDFAAQKIGSATKLGAAILEAIDDLRHASLDDALFRWPASERQR